MRRLARIERDFGVAPAVMLGLWGIESAYGDPSWTAITAPRPPRSPRSRGPSRAGAYWEQTFVIVERGWAAPTELRGSLAGAMGRTQWRPDIWLTLGLDYDGDGRVSPFGAPDDALGSSARYLVRRGSYRRGEPWGCEVRLPASVRATAKPRTYRAWSEAGVARADGASFTNPDASARLWVPVDGGPAFPRPELTPMSYNPSTSHTLALLHPGDRSAVRPRATVSRERGRPPWPRCVEIQRRLTALGYDTGGVDGRTRQRHAHAGVGSSNGWHDTRGRVCRTLLARLREKSLTDRGGPAIATRDRRDAGQSAAAFSEVRSARDQGWFNPTAARNSGSRSPTRRALLSKCGTFVPATASPQLGLVDR
jgi:hypothetical protein